MQEESKASYNLGELISARNWHYSFCSGGTVLWPPRRWAAVVLDHPHPTAASPGHSARGTGLEQGENKVIQGDQLLDLVQGKSA